MSHGVQGASSNAPIPSSTNPPPAHSVMHCDDLVGHIGKFLPTAACREMRRVSHGLYRVFGQIIARRSLAGNACKRQQELMAYAQKHLHLHGSGAAHDRFSRLMAATQSNVFELHDEIHAESQRLQQRIRSLQDAFWHACRRHAAAWRRAGFGARGMRDTGLVASHAQHRLQMPLAVSLATAPTDTGPSLVMLGILLHAACCRAYPVAMTAESLGSMASPPRHGVAPLPPQPDLVFIEQLIEKTLAHPQPDGIWAIEASGPFSAGHGRARMEEFLEFLVLHRCAPELQQLEAHTHFGAALLFEESRVQSLLGSPSGTHAMYRLWRAMPGGVDEKFSETCLDQALRRDEWAVIDEILQRYPRLFWGQHRDRLVADMLRLAHNPAPETDKRHMLSIFSRMHANHVRPPRAHPSARPLHTHCLIHQRPAIGEDPIPLVGELDRQAHAITREIEALWQQPDFARCAPALVKRALDQGIQIPEPLLLATICRLDHAGHYDTAIRTRLLKTTQYTEPRLGNHAWKSGPGDATPLHTILRFDALAVLQAYSFKIEVSLRDLHIDQYGQSVPLALAARMFNATKVDYCLNREGSPFDLKSDQATMSFLRALAIDHPALLGTVLPMIRLSRPCSQMIPLLRERQPWANTLAIRHFQSKSRSDSPEPDTRVFFRSCVEEALAQKPRMEEVGILLKSIESAICGARISFTSADRDAFIHICRRHNNFDAIPLVLRLPYRSRSRCSHIPLLPSEKINLLRLCQGKTVQKTQQRYLQLRAFLKEAGITAEAQELDAYCLWQIDAGQAMTTHGQPHASRKHAPDSDARKRGIDLPRRTLQPMPVLASPQPAKYDISPILHALAPLLLEQEAKRARIQVRLEALISNFTTPQTSLERQAASAVLRNALADARLARIQTQQPGKLFHALCMLDDGTLYAEAAANQGIDVESLFDFRDPDASATHLRYPFNMLVAYGARSVSSRILQQRSTLPGKWIEDAIPWIGASLKQGGSDGEIILLQALRHLNGTSFVHVLQRIVDACPASLINQRDPVHLAVKSCPQHFSGKQQVERIRALAARVGAAGQVGVAIWLQEMTRS